MACKTPYYVKRPARKDVPVPCGRCPDCKKRRVNDWVFRLQQQDRISHTAYFITLTYDNDHITLSKNKFKTLVKKDLQLFFKRLRERQKKLKIKYYACGEYGGSKKRRPHYHAIIFNVEKVESISDCWTLGLTHYGTVTGASIAYTCKYIDKKKRIPEFKNDDRLPEFSIMSKKLGVNFLTDNVVKHYKSNLSNALVYTKQGTKIALPRYYKKKIYTEFEADAQAWFIAAQVEKQEKEEEFRFYNDSGNKNLDYHVERRERTKANFNQFFKSQNKRYYDFDTKETSKSSKTIREE